MSNLEDIAPSNGELPSVRVTKDGPYRVSGGLRILRQIIQIDEEGGSREWVVGDEIMAPATFLLCRCGQSSNKPFCDGSHLSFGFDGTESAQQLPYLDQAEVIEGPELTLTDVESLCAFGRFCDPDGGVWNLVLETDSARGREMFLSEATRCPGGRLVPWEKNQPEPLEPAYEPSIGLVEDTKLDVSGGILVRGRVSITSADGQNYEIRNRVALCRCGASSNKPFCDGSHASTEFLDETFHAARGHAGFTPEKL